MNLDFSEDQKLLAKTARDYLEEHSPLSACREVLESEARYKEELWKGAAEMGWLGTAVPEEYGGAGFSHLELAVVAEELGRALAPIPFSSSVYLATEALLLAGKSEQKSKYLPKLVSGELIGTLAVTARPGRTTESSIQASFKGGVLNGVKAPVPDGDIAGLAAVAARESNGSISLVLVDLSGKGVERTPLDSIDPSRSLAQIRFTDAPAELLGGSGGGWSTIERVQDRAAILLAFEQLGGAERAFEITREYAMGRYAFGRPIASFQALKHRMADIWAALQLARSNCYFGAYALSNESDELPVAACAARVSASEAFELASQEMIQIHGGVGYTWEYDCHLFYRRAKLQAVTLGSPSVWKENLISRLEDAQA